MKVANETVGKPITNPSDIAAIARAVLATEDKIDQDKEHFWAIGLNGNNLVAYVELVSLGTVNAAQGHPREIFRRAIMEACVSLIVMHNHPSGKCTPSDQDRTLTGQLVDAGKLLAIEVLDHVIVTKNSYYSFAEERTLK